MTTTHTALDKLKTSREKINVRIQRLEALEKERRRKNETRRKFLIGDVVLRDARKNKTMQTLIAKVAPHLTRASDRRLFGLDKLSDEETPSEE